MRLVKRRTSCRLQEIPVREIVEAVVLVAILRRAFKCRVHPIIAKRCRPDLSRARWLDNSSNASTAALSEGGRSRPFGLCPVPAIVFHRLSSLLVPEERLPSYDHTHELFLHD
jgi:hypothetical protein